MKLRVATYLLSTLATLLVSSVCVRAQQAPSVPPVFLEKSTPWADSVLNTLSLEQKIGQLFMVAAWSDPKHQSYDVAGMDLLIKKYGIGGVIFFQGSPVRQAQLINRFQQEAKVPLMVGMDAEWGLGMRLDSTISYPRQMTLGAIQDESLIYDFGQEMARQLKRLGVQVSFSPCVDINNNPLNPVISNRSFGEDRDIVSHYSYQYMKGLQDGGVLANAKHFPGHGDTGTDSHKDLPVIPYGKDRLDSLELYPYRYLMQRGLGSVMIAHLSIPEIDSTPNVPSTLSPKIVNGLLRNEMGFNGLVFTDALNMQGVSKYFAPGETDLRALMAGNDVLLYSLNVAKAIDKIKAAVDSGMVAQAVIDEHCLRILRAKEWCGLNKWQPVNTKNLVADLNSPEAQALQRRIVERSITVVKNEGNLSPLCHSDESRVAVVCIGTDTDNPFVNSMRKYAKFDVFSMEKNPDIKTSMRLHDTLSTYNIVVAAMLNTSNKASKNFGVSNEAARILNSLGRETTVVFSVFANPYAFNTMKDLSNIKTVLMCYQDDAMTEEVAAEVIAGACTADGRLPVSANANFPLRLGVDIEQTRLRWVTPAYIGICSENSFVNANDNPASHSDTNGQVNGNGKTYKEDMMSDKGRKGIKTEDRCFAKVDTIANYGIQKGAYPGCRVLVAKDGFVIYDKAFGHLDWDKKEKVTVNTVYDLASVTKLASTTLASMKLVDEGKLDVNKTLGDYLKLPEGSEYNSIVIKEMLAHQAGLTPWIPFYTKTMSNGTLRADIYTSKTDNTHHAQVAEGLFMLDSYRDSMWSQIYATPLSSERTYKYSDLAFYFMQRIVEEQTGEKLDTYVNKTFYKPMGLQSIGYKPLSRFAAKDIAPTEYDKTWRHQHVRGYVHDQGAAMLGGVAGHAGLFGTAQDLAEVMEMLLNQGNYAGKQLLSPKVIEQFNTRYYPNNRRGLGFDKPALNGGGSACAEVSASSFGHTGFTGTMCWADPASGIVFVFLSNRVNPDAENKKIQELDIRTRIQSEVYKVLGYEEK
jgi:beta-N-acetylhexosaminidase